MNESETAYPRDAAITADTGSGSGSSPGLAGPASSAGATRSTTGKLLIDGWVCDDATNPFLHRIHRSVTAPGEGFPTQLVLTVGDEQDENTSAITMPPAVLDWLMSGKLKETSDGTD